MQVFITRSGEIGLIRYIDIEDAGKLIEYHQIIAVETDYLTFTIDEVNTSIERQVELIRDFITQGNNLYIAAVVDYKIVGVLRFSGNMRSRMSQVGEFGVTVLKEYWSQGIGLALVNYLINWAEKSQVIKKINLTVRSDNERAKNLYRKLGFKEEGIKTREFMINGVFYSSVLMGLPID